MEISREEENKYISENSGYWSQQKILASFSKIELQTEIKNMEYIYKKEREKLLKIYKNFLLENDYKNCSEIEKYFLQIFFMKFLGGDELTLYKEVIDNFNRYYKINHTDLYKNSNFIPFDIKKVKIKDVISMYMKLPNNLRKNILCPFHEERTGSFKIYEASNTFKCFGCGAGGNAVNFISMIENISLKEAYKKLIILFK